MRFTRVQRPSAEIYNKFVTTTKKMYIFVNKLYWINGLNLAMERIPMEFDN